jgi:hypothetical protein
VRSKIVCKKVISPCIRQVDFVHLGSSPGVGEFILPAREP